ncbi:hypothetical protein GCM10027570_25600 [Streptomonospora sediminis]
MNSATEPVAAPRGRTAAPGSAATTGFVLRKAADQVNREFSGNNGPVSGGLPH